MDYGNLAKFAAEVYAGVNWNGASSDKIQNETVEYGHPIEGYPLWQDAGRFWKLKMWKMLSYSKIYYGA